MADGSERIKWAIVREKPLKARRIELGGDYYYKCYWKDCDADVTAYHNYCWKCGQRLSYE